MGINEIDDKPSGILPVNCGTLIEMLDMLIVIGKAEGATVHTEATPRFCTAVARMCGIDG